VAAVEAAGQHPTWVHLANSAAVLEGTVALKAHALARPGLMLYGYPPAARFAGDADLEPVLTWATAITHLKRVPPGFKVSYGQTWAAPRESLVATLPVGYADGYDRRHSNGAPVLVRGRRCEIIGRVCMDMCMVDVTDVPGVAIGDEVVLLGRQGDAFVGADELAERIGTIPYEVLCAIGERVPRDP
jgi:alanine racemase